MEENRTNTSDILVTLAKEYNNLAKEYDEYTRECKCALRNLTSRLENLREEMRCGKGYNIISFIETRIKTLESTCNKLEDRNVPRTMESIRELHDIAGVRIIVPFEDDIWKVKETLSRQQSLSIIEAKDYINNPKDNGYRSLHLICEMSYHSYSEKRTVPVEIQIRTKAMDVWASLEHEIRYKNPALESDEADEIEAKVVDTFKRIAELLNDVDNSVMNLRNETNVHAATEYL